MILNLELKFDEKNKKKLKLVLLFLIILFHFFNNCVFITQCPLELVLQGKSWHMQTTIFNKLLDKMQWGEKSRFYNSQHSLLKNFTQLTIWWPPLYYYCAYVVHLLFKFLTARAFLLTSSFFFICLLVFCYKLSEKILSNSGILTVFICSFFPYIYCGSRIFNLEIPVTAFIVMNLYFYLQTDNFKNKFYSIMFGVFMGIGMLIKFSILLFLIIPILSSLCEIVKTRKTEPEWIKKRNNFFLSCIIGIILPAVYYFNAEVINEIIVRALNFDNPANDFTTAERFRCYFSDLIEDVIGKRFFLLSLFPGFLFFKKHKKEAVLFFKIIVFSFVVICVLPKYNPQTEYLIPLIPILGIITSIGIQSIKWKPIKYLMIILILINGLKGYNVCATPVFPYKYYDFKNKSIFTQMGEDGEKIGYLTFEKERIGYADRLEVLWFVHNGKKNNKIEYIFHDPESFFKHIGDYDFLIYTTVDKNSWPDNLVKVKKQFLDLLAENKSVSKYCKKGTKQIKNKYKILFNEWLEELINAKQNFIQIAQWNSLSLLILDVPGTNIFIYKRK